MSVEGGCLCGDVRFAIGREPAASLNCHCSRCRKSHGAPFGSFAVINRRYFRWLAGEERLRSYRATPELERFFCPRCGTHLAALEAWNPKGITIAMGCFDGDPGIRPEGHMFVGSRAPWYTIADELPASATWPEGLGPAA